MDKLGEDPDKDMPQFELMIHFHFVVDWLCFARKYFHKHAQSWSVAEVLKRSIAIDLS